MLSSNIRALLPDLKTKYGSIYLIDVTEFKTSDKLGSDLLIRAMTRSGFNLFTDEYVIDPVIAIQKLIATHVYPQDSIDEYLAGIDEYICTAISNISSFSSEESLAEGVEDARNYARSLEAAITIFICKAFSSLTPKDVDNMTFEDQMKYVSLAEQMLGKELPYEEFLNDGKPTKSPKAKIPEHAFAPPSEGFEYSHGGAQPNQDNHTVVTPDNLDKVMKQTREMFSG